MKRRRWSRSVENGLQFVYSMMSCIESNGDESHIDCSAGPDFTRCNRPSCEQCQNLTDLGNALDWLGREIDIHRKPRTAKKD